MRRWVNLALLLGVGLGLAAGLRADAAEAQAYYRRGLALQTAKRYAKAEACYKAALRSDPKAAYALKALGTNAYLAGDRPAALRWYRQYLALNPFDQATKAFADRLERALGPEALKPREKHLGNGVDIHLTVAGTQTDSQDLTQIYGPGGPGSVNEISPSFAVGGSWGFSAGPTLGLDLSFGPMRSYTVNLSNGIRNDWTFTPFNVMLELGWRIALTDGLVLQPRVGLGLDMVTAQVSSTNGFSETADGVGPAFWPELVCEYELGHWGIALAAGYYSSSVSPLTGTDGQAAWTTPSGETWTLVTHGITLGLGCSFHFRPLLR